MTVPDAYSNFLLSTDYAHLNEGRGTIDLVSQRNYTLDRAFNGADPKKVLQNGKEIKNFFRAKRKGTAHTFGVGTKEKATQPQTLQEMLTPWSFMRDDITYDDEVFDLHEGNMAQRFVDLREVHVADCYNEKLTFMETDQFWAQPDPASMEVTQPKPDVRNVTSFNTLVNEENFGNDNAGLPQTYVSASVFTIQSVDSRATGNGGANWRCQQVQYTGGPDDGTSFDLLPKLDEMFHLTKFSGLPLGYGRYSRMSKMPAVVWCTVKGKVMYIESMRRSQDTLVWTGRQDTGYSNPTIHGIPVDELETLRTASIYPTGTSGAYSTENDTTNSNGGPRYTFANLADIYPVVHSNKWFYMHKPQSPYGMPNRHTHWVDSYWNLTAETRRTSGVVFPSANITNYT